MIDFAALSDVTSTSLATHQILMLSVLMNIVSLALFVLFRDSHNVNRVYGALNYLWPLAAVLVFIDAVPITVALLVAYGFLFDFFSLQEGARMPNNEKLITHFLLNIVHHVSVVACLFKDPQLILRVAMALCWAVRAKPLISRMTFLPGNTMYYVELLSNIAPTVALARSWLLAGGSTSDTAVLISIQMIFYLSFYMNTKLDVPHKLGITVSQNAVSSSKWVAVAVSVAVAAMLMFPMSIKMLRMYVGV